MNQSQENGSRSNTESQENSEENTVSSPPAENGVVVGSGEAGVASLLSEPFNSEVVNRNRADVAMEEEKEEISNHDEAHTIRGFEEADAFIIPLEEGVNCDDDLAELKRAAYGGPSSGSDDDGLFRNDLGENGLQATAVAIANGGLQHTSDAVHAQVVVGQDMPFGGVLGGSAAAVDPLLQPQIADSLHGEEYTAEASVLPLNEESIDCDDDDRKLPPVEESRSNSDGRDLEVALSNQEAEVVDIQEDVHPDEFVGLNDTQAELVGTSECAVATPYESHVSEVTLVSEENLVSSQDDGTGFRADAVVEATAADVGVTVEELQGEVLAIQEDTQENVFSDDQAVHGEVLAIQEETHANEFENDVAIQGEVLAIQEETHPNEFAEDHAVEAQLIGLDGSGNANAAVATSEPLATSEVVGEAMILETPAEPERRASFQGPSIEKPPRTPLEATAAALPEASAPAAAVLPEMATPAQESIYPEKPEAPDRAVRFHNCNGGRPEEPPDDRPDWLRDTPPGTPMNATNPEVSAASSVSERSGGSGNSAQRLQALSNNLARSTTNVMEALFGDSSPPFLHRRGRSSTSDIAGCIVPRKLLPWSVIFSPPTKMWVATLQTNQKALDKNNITEASKSLRAFSLPTEKSAVALAKAWTPPRMTSFSDFNSCHICSARFAFLRRPCHCRNCGVVICKDCSVPWPAKMIPDTYNFKKESVINVCLSCDWLSNQFRLALLEGKQDQAVAIHATGNINLHAPFANVKGELFYPVHCAALGGSLTLLKWLVDENCCPIKSLRVSGGGASGTYTPIVTSKGRSLLGISMENESVDMIRYLVVKKGISLSGEKDVTFELLLRNLDKVLRILPDDLSSTGVPPSHAEDGDVDASMLSIVSHRNFGEDDNARSSSDEARNLEANDVNDDCIICFDGKIDCVTVPCGHQICCLKCSEHITRCPVCSADCTFMRVFKP